MTAPVLSPPDMEKPFYLVTDACQTGIGAILQQKKDDQLVTIAFFSKKLSKSQQHYSATELELYAPASISKCTFMEVNCL